MWGDFAAWVQSAGGARVLQTAVLPAVAILVAGVLAALIGRAALRSAIGRADREQAAAAIAGLIEAARAATEPDRPRGGRRRSARLRTEADIRLRLLSVHGADRAADWSAAQTDALVAAGSVDLTSLRDTLIAWLRSPRRAARLFATVPGAPVRLAPVSTPASAPRDPVAAAVAAETVDAPAATADDAEVPAWRRTKAAERLEHDRAERAASRQEPAEPDPLLQDAAEQTARVRFRRPSPIETALDADTPADTTPARHSVETEAEPSPPRVPAWIDTYDDEADVTQNLDLRTPPPVSASTIRDRAPARADIVPRS